MASSLPHRQEGTAPRDLLLTPPRVKDCLLVLHTVSERILLGLVDPLPYECPASSLPHREARGARKMNGDRQKCELAVVLLLAFVVAAVNATRRAGCQRFHSDVNANSH